MKNLLTILLFSIFIWACNKDNDGFLSSKIELLSPLNSTVSSCNVTFEWNAKMLKKPYLLEVATDENFENIVISESLKKETYTVNGTLQPLKKYYWRVQGDGITETASFETENNIADFIGIFEASVFFDCVFPFPGDSTWTTMVEITIDENGNPNLLDLNSHKKIKTTNFVSKQSCTEFNYEDRQLTDYEWVVIKRCKFNFFNGKFEFMKEEVFNNSHPRFVDSYTYTGIIN